MRDDLAEAAVAVLTDRSLFDGITAPLTASRTYTFAEIAQIASGILNHEVSFEMISEQSYRQAPQRGFPEPVVGMLVSMFDAIHDGEFNVVDPTLERLLTRKPAEFEVVLAPYLSSPRAAPGH